MVITDPKPKEIPKPKEPPKPIEGGTFTSDNYGNLIKHGDEGTGTAIGGRQYGGNGGGGNSGSTQIVAEGSKGDYSYTTVESSQQNQQVIDQARKQAVAERQQKELQDAANRQIEQVLVKQQQKQGYEQTKQVYAPVQTQYDPETGQIKARISEDNYAIVTGGTKKTAQFNEAFFPNQKKFDVKAKAEDLKRQDSELNKGKGGNDDFNSDNHSIGISSLKQQARLEKRIDTLSESKEYLGKDYKGIKAVQIELGLASTSFLLTGKEIILHPIKNLAVPLFDFVTLEIRKDIRDKTPIGYNFAKQGETLFTNIMTKPGETIGSFCAQAVIIGMAAKVTPIPVVRTIKAGEDTITTISLEKGSFSQPIVSFDKVKLERTFETPIQVAKDFNEVIIEPIKSVVKQNKEVTTSIKEITSEATKTQAEPFVGAAQDFKSLIIEPVQTISNIGYEPIKPSMELLKEGIQPILAIKSEIKETFVEPISSISKLGKEPVISGIRMTSDVVMKEIIETPKSDFKTLISEPAFEVGKMFAIDTKNTVNSLLPEGISIGTPSISHIFKGVKQVGAQKDILRIGNPTETKIIKNMFEEYNTADVIYTPRAKELIPTLQTFIKETQNVKSQFKKNFPKETARLDSVGVEYLLSRAKELNARVTGSFSRAAQLKDSYKIDDELFIYNKKPNDIDFHLNMNAEKILEEVKISERGLKELGYETRLAGKGSAKNGIEIKKNGKWEKVTEYLNDKELVGIEEQMPDQVLGFQKEGKPYIQEGLKTTELNEELRGVIQGVSRVRNKYTGEEVSKYQGLTKKEIKEGVEFHHTNYLTKEGVKLTKQERDLWHNIDEGRIKIKSLIAEDKNGGVKLTKQERVLLRDIKKGKVKIDISELKEFYNKNKIIDAGTKMDIFPPEKRVKDIGSIFVSAKTLEASKFTYSLKLNKAIEKFESMFPESTVREQVIKAELADFSKSSSTESKANPTTAISASSSPITQKIKTTESVSDYLKQNSPSVSTGTSSISSSSIFSFSPISSSRSVSKSISSLSVSSSPSISSSSPSVSSSPSRSSSPSKSSSPSRSVSSFHLNMLLPFVFSIRNIKCRFVFLYCPTS